MLFFHELSAVEGGGRYGAGEEFSEKEVQQAMDVLDADGNGSVNLEEFVTWFKGGCLLSEETESEDATTDAVAEDDEHLNVSPKTKAAETTEVFSE